MAIPAQDRRFAPRLVMTITREEDEKKLEAVLDHLLLPICYQCRGKGTAPSEMLDIFGLSGTTRLITISIAPKDRVGEFMQAAGKQVSFHKRGGGIVLSIPITGIQNPIFQVLNEDAKQALQQRIQEGTERDMSEMSSHMKYVLIWVSVAAGPCKKDIDAARAAGAKGGTVVKGRQRHSERLSQRLGISMQEERDFVMIVVPREKKAGIMGAIANTCGLASQAHGVLLSLPIDEVFGLEE